MIQEVMTDAASQKWVETENTYFLRDVATNSELTNLNHLTAVVFPELRRTDKRFYEDKPRLGKRLMRITNMTPSVMSFVTSMPKMQGRRMIFKRRLLILASICWCHKVSR